MAATRTTKTPKLQRSTRYRIDAHLNLCCRTLGISPDTVLRRADLPQTCLSPEFGGVSAADFFKAWLAMEQEYGHPDMAERLAQAVAFAIFTPAVFAFSCSRNIQKGLERLAQYEPLIGPFELSVETTQQSMTMRFAPAQSGLTFPDSVAEFLMALFLERFRRFTGAAIRPLALELPSPPLSENYEWGCDITAGPLPAMVLSLEDARKPLISENADLWKSFEPALRRKLAEKMADATVSERLRNALLEAIPSGDITSGLLADRLHMSKRSLQRHLKDEGTSYQQVLDETRTELSKHYLMNTKSSIDEVSFLLGYSNSTSFFRAFQNWFGKTPSEFRSAPRGEGRS